MEDSTFTLNDEHRDSSAVYARSDVHRPLSSEDAALILSYKQAIPNNTCAATWPIPVRHWDEYPVDSRRDVVVP